MALSHGKLRIQPLHLFDKGFVACFKSDVLGKAYDRQTRLDPLVRFGKNLFC
jgi:hypothetical protein